MTTNSDGRVHFSHTAMSFLEYRRRTELRTVLCLLSQALLFLMAWTPYAVVSLIGQFGPLDEGGQVQWLSPLTTSIPSFFAKSAIVSNPLIYGFFHPKFRSSVSRILRQFDIGNRDATQGLGGRQVTNDIRTMIMREMMPITTRRNPRRQPQPASLAAAVPSPSIDRERNPSPNLSTHNRSDVGGNPPRLHRGIRFYIYHLYLKIEKRLISYISLDFKI